MSWVDPVTLHGEYVTLEPLSANYHDDPIAAVEDGDLWNLWYTSVPAPSKMSVEIERRLALLKSGSMVPFAVIERGTNEAVGMTTYMNIDPESRRVEIGSTWYRKRVQRTPVNTECKLLLLTHAFDTLRCIAVEFRTSSFNHQSRRSIERLGATLDGVLRSHSMHANGTLRDTFVYSIISAEWPAVRANLTYRLKHSAARNNRSEQV